MDVHERVTAALYPDILGTERLKFNGVGSPLVNLNEVRRLFDAVEAPDEIFTSCSWSEHETARDSIDYLTERERQWRAGEKAEYLIYEREGDGNPAIGTCYWAFDDEFTTATLGMWLRKPYWGHGYASERADEFIQVAFEDIGVSQVRVGCLVWNDKSRRSIEKYMERHGGSYDGTVSVARARYDGVNECVGHHEWSLTRQEYTDDEATLTSNIPGVEYDDVDF